MNDAFDDLESQLRRAVRSRRRTRPPCMRRGHGRTTAALILAMLVISAGALAAGGVIKIGKPAETGVPGARLIPRRGGGIVKGTARLLSLSIPDPVSGPPWGMRIYSRKFGEGCAQIGRLLDGKLGALGQDNAFRDDGLFHEFAVDTFGAKGACTLLDGNNRLFLNATVGDLPASAWEGFVKGTCVPSTAGRYERFAEDGKRKPYAICPQADERNVYYGLLGPAAKSVTYKLNGHSYTQATVGPEGAYLIVTKASPKQLLNFSAGSTQDVVPVDGPITELRYQGGATCHLTSRSWIGGKDACTPELAEPFGWAPLKMPPPSAARVASPVDVRLLHASDGGYEAILHFRSRVAVDSARSAYTVQWHESGQPPQVNTFAPPTPTFPAAGQTVSLRMGRSSSHHLHAGIVAGEVIFQQQTGPGNLEEAGGTVRRTVGHFKFAVP